jgi:hypothetical protein
VWLGGENMTQGNHPAIYSVWCICFRLGLLRARMKKADWQKLPDTVKKANQAEALLWKNDVLGM